MGTMSKSISVATEESRQNVMREINRKGRALSQLINDLIEKVPQFSRKTERYIFVAAYGDKKSGSRAYRAVNKSADTCVRAFCVARLKRHDIESAIVDQQQKMLDFITTAPAI